MVFDGAIEKVRKCMQCHENVTGWIFYFPFSQSPDLLAASLPPPDLSTLVLRYVEIVGLCGFQVNLSDFPISIPAGEKIPKNAKQNKKTKNSKTDIEKRKVLDR